jgi:hypothetical protein
MTARDELLRRLVERLKKHYVWATNDLEEDLGDAIEAIREMLEQKPVAWLQNRAVDSYLVPGSYETCGPTDYGAFAVYALPVAAPAQGRATAWVAKGPRGGVYHFAEKDGWTVDAVVFEPAQAQLRKEKTDDQDASGST